ncbi:hypothetical protein AAG570_004773 [Ranatra chinensis]|uniref:Uncharacterized protein n=1 Tax=Ranatra chinensis TaxID=642074 RepID=A0ABD0Y2L0_9HEMI
MSTQEDVGSGGAATASQDNAHDNTRRFLPRLPPSYGRPHHPYAAMMYPEFQYRAPPPSYQASMQEYRLRLLLLDRHTTASPPPTYRSHPSTLLRRDLCGPPEYSRPPSYRSRTSTEAQAAAAAVHSRQVSQASGGGGPGGGGDSENTVTIVQSAEEPTGPVILTISGGESLHHHHRPAEQMEILAHL